jgi:hypothetical protein
VVAVVELVTGYPHKCLQCRLEGKIPASKLHSLMKLLVIGLAVAAGGSFSSLPSKEATERGYLRGGADIVLCVLILRYE